MTDRQTSYLEAADNYVYQYVSYAMHIENTITWNTIWNNKICKICNFK